MPSYRFECLSKGTKDNWHLEHENLDKLYNVWDKPLAKTHSNRVKFNTSELH